MADDWFTRAFGNAVTDVRQRLIERGWFGEVVTPSAQTITLGTSPGDDSPGEMLGWFKKHFGNEGRGKDARDIHGNSQQHDPQKERGHDLER